MLLKLINGNDMEISEKKIRVRLNARADDLLEYTLLSLIFARLPLEFREFGIEIFLAGLKCRDFDESSFFKVIKFRKSSSLVLVS